jgi:hypothetical protein
MSLLSMLGLMITAATAVAKLPKPDPRDQEIAGLKIDLADAQRVGAMWRERAESSERDLRQAELERDLFRCDAHRWRERAIDRNFAAFQALQQPSLQQYTGSQPPQYQEMIAAANLQNAQMQAQMGLISYRAPSSEFQALLGQAQAFPGLNPEVWCNCVPSRAQVWVAMGGGDA